MKRILGAGLLILSFNTHAFFEDEEAREKINDLQNQLNSLKSDQLRLLEDKVTDLQQVLQGGSLQQFNSKINEILDDIAKIRGDVEVLQFNFESFEDRQKINYQDIENRFSRLEEELESLKNNSQNKEELLKETTESNQAQEVQENPVTSIESIQGDIAQELESTEQQGVIGNVETGKDLPPLIDEEQELNMFNDAEGLMR